MNLDPVAFEPDSVAEESTFPGMATKSSSRDAQPGHRPASAGAIRARINKLVEQEFASSSPSPEPLLAHEQRIKVLSDAIETLRPTRKMVLILRVWDGLSYAQIESRFAADGVSVNERTLLHWYADALKELRQAILAAEELGEARSKCP